MKELDKSLRRKTRSPFLHYRETIVVELLQGDVIRLRLHVQRETNAVSRSRNCISSWSNAAWPLADCSGRN
jgi:hypothetical protein